MSVEQDQKLHALVAQWRQFSNEATTADAVVTYRECADALEAAIVTKILLAVCEGCGTEQPMPTKNTRKVYPDLPAGWSQCGVSKHRLAGYGARLAAWCIACRTKRKSGIGGMSDDNRKIGDICYIDHKTGESDRMFAHTYSERCKPRDVTMVESISAALTQKGSRGKP